MGQLTGKKKINDLKISEPPQTSLFGISWTTPEPSPEPKGAKTNGKKPKGEKPKGMMSWFKGCFQGIAYESATKQRPIGISRIAPVTAPEKPQTGTTTPVPPRLGQGGIFPQEPRPYPDYRFVPSNTTRKPPL